MRNDGKKSGPGPLSALGITLTPLQIHEKEFGYSLRGYNIEEVDLYLDRIIKDYEAFERIVQEMQNYIKDLQEEIAAKPKVQAIPTEQATFNARPAAPQAAPSSTNSNLHANQSQSVESLLQRIRDLEIYCFGRIKG